MNEPIAPDGAPSTESGFDLTVTIDGVEYRASRYWCEGCQRSAFVLASRGRARVVDVLAFTPLDGPRVKRHLCRGSGEGDS